jgi:hypothetical protein
VEEYYFGMIVGEVEGENWVVLGVSERVGLGSLKNYYEILRLGCYFGTAAGEEDLVVVEVGEERGKGKLVLLPVVKMVGALEMFPQAVLVAMVEGLVGVVEVG